MASIVIQNLEDLFVQRLHEGAELRGCSVDAEAKSALEEAVYTVPKDPYFDPRAEFRASLEAHRTLPEYTEKDEVWISMMLEDLDKPDPVDEHLEAKAPPEDPEAATSSLVIANVHERLERALRIRAEQNGRSLEEEARDILRASLNQWPPRTFGPKLARMQAVFKAVEEAVGPIEFKLELPPREFMREPPTFD